MSIIKKILAITVAAILVLFISSAFTVMQGQEGIMLRLGRLVEEKGSNRLLVLEPGLHFKVPFIDSVRLFDVRLQTFDIKSSRIVTREKKDVMVDYFVKWRIENLANYYKSTGGNAFKAETLLEQQLNTSLRAEFGKRTISDVVTGGRDDVMDVLRVRAEQQAHGLGIAVTDVRIKGIELPDNTSNAIYQRMRADMQKIANRHRADGSAQAEAIQANADAEVTVLLAKAESEGQKVRAAGQAEAAAIYEAAYGQNPRFFGFYRSLKAYEQSFSGRRDVLVLDQNSAFFEYFKHGLTPGVSTSVKK
ncbi:HflC protein [Legionella geestiana]|uniref:Protein HflC n=1 Tax=Legionella geestiana TaxID=45065 RepID=A0A0W0U829_9GAMM|nr:protease modulator HflC [Legionella geestiana]KTD03783.1 HflC protein [Legionella geestiana]QBS11931.1 protease modulator HflC [Legionella geestiana]QDQ40456.1 protease modulator HflC [Legionella geestiana]STX53356.1 HflC protein [Legionella geestiana]